MTLSKISLCMIVKNEERCLERCLESVKDVVSEIIIVDTGSTDSTLDIAKKYTDHVYHYEWNNDFSDARNYALQYATGDFILHLDADEYIGKNKESLLMPLDQDYYYVRIRNDLGHGVAEVHRFIRLFRNDPVLRYEGALHEQVDMSKHPHLKPGLIDAVIYHDGYLEDIVREKSKKKRNMKIIQDEVKKNPNAFNYFNLGVQFSLEDRHTEALKAFQKAYSLGKGTSYAPRILMFIMKSLSEMGRNEEAVAVGEDSAILYADHADFQYRLGLIYENVGYDKDAEQCFLKCLEIGEARNALQFNHYEGTASYLAHGKLAELYLRNGQHELAKKHFLKAVQEAPDLSFLIQVFIELFPSLRGNEFVDALFKIWPFNDLKRVEQMVSVLYSLRHPGALDLVRCYKVKVPVEFEGWAATLEGDYSAAKRIWSEIEHVRDAFFGDLILLGVLSHDPDPLIQNRHVFSLRNREWRWWNSLVCGEELPEMPFSKEMKEQLIKLVNILIRLGQFTSLEQLIHASSQPIFRFIIADQLNKKGFKEIALDIIVESSESSENVEIYALVRDILRDLGNVDDALYYAKQAYGVLPNYSNGYQLLKLLETCNQIVEAREVQSELMNLEPKSLWFNKTYKIFSSLT
ncbi:MULTISPECIES: glycosyltransferase [Paenibacillus]|uniref:Glycosyltransferase 2-like domain-containing protein n=1 Tax=Paenibacillus albilobatus TaxID=2716884 RepID=A0A919XNC0_9BACL|nr:MULTISPECIES: glycosyltransferase [Paenibacillus]GIO33303.1 hypothetical protein J2TS6_44440 [Paenibacillus albilobatus]